jgi:hypothetical protein
MFFEGLGRRRVERDRQCVWVQHEKVIKFAEGAGVFPRALFLQGVTRTLQRFTNAFVD